MTMTHQTTFLSISLYLFLTSCASYKTYNPVQSTTVAEMSEKKETPLHTIFLIGDAGGSTEGKVAPTLSALKHQLDELGDRSSVIFLGDNIYPDGLPPKKDEDRKAASFALEAQLAILQDYDGRAIVIPGNHDWRRGLKGVERQAKYVRDFLDDDGIFLPEKGCAGPELVHLTKDLILIVIDSEWWLRDWDEEPSINADCEVQTREELIRDFTGLLKKNREKEVIIAFHHPLYTYGNHGGYFSGKDHLFPLANLIEGLYLPLPIVGSLYPLLRANAGIKQDNNYQPFKDFKSRIIASTNDYENLVFVAGHEHNLQYIHKDHPFIVSGSGSKSTPLHQGKYLQFGTTELGYVAIDQYENGRLDVRFFTVDASAQSSLVFRKTIKEPSSEQEPPPSSLSTKSDSVSVSIYKKEATDKSGFYNWLWGSWYRSLYSSELTVPVLDLQAELGGLEPIRRGGGMQTRSLRLKDPNGRHYALRALEKKVDLLLPKAFDNTFAVDLMRDFFTTAHPYSAFIIPSMADAIGVYHTNPKLCYLPKQPYLKQYNREFGDGLYLFEERPAGDRSDVASFGYSTDIISSLDLLQKLQKNDNHHIDKAWVVRSRLFDLVLSDWDRHDDQWRWAKFEEGDQKIYRPIPRDRDQAFAKFDGFLTGLATRAVISLRPMQRFPERTKKIHWLTWGTRYFDRRFLNELTWEEWKPQIKRIQGDLTDAVIDDAIAQWPEVIRQQGGSEVARTLKARRDNLHLMASDLYKFLAKSVDVVGTNKADFFLVERQTGGKTRVRVFQNKGQEKENKIYDRTFIDPLTKEIILYGLDGKDDFRVIGSAVHSPIIRLVGGQGEDTFLDESSVKGISKKTKIYDDLRKNKLQPSQETKDLRSQKRLANEYHFREFNYPFTLAIPYVSIYSDDGLFVGGLLNHEIPKFKKKPFGQLHQFNVNYAFVTNAFQFKWKGTFTEVLGRWDFSPSFHFQTPRYAQNFYGLGNESQNLMDNDFYRVRTKTLRIVPALQRRFNSGASITVAAFFEQLKVEQTEDRIISMSNLGVRNAIFQNQSYLGGSLAYQIENKDNPVYPRRGMKFFSQATLQQNTQVKDRSFQRLSGELTFYLPVDKRHTVVFATQVGLQQIFGEFDFYHAAIIGGLSNLRGFRIQRFSGRAAAYHSNDLRIPLLKIRNNILPMAIGITLSGDYGRVWWDTEDSNLWHSSYGGSLWFNFVNSAVFRVGLHQGSEGTRFLAGLGYAF